LKIEKGKWAFYRDDKPPTYHSNDENAPEIILDTLGFENQRYIPNPGVYIKRPCSCGVKHQWTTGPEQTFFIDSVDIYGPDRIPIKKCSKCGDILVLELEKPEEE
jgi:hypothetical protein